MILFQPKAFQLDHIRVGAVRHDQSNVHLATFSLDVNLKRVRESIKTYQMLNTFEEIFVEIMAIERFPNGAYRFMSIGDLSLD